MADNATIRQWALDNGFALRSKGRLPAAALRAYEAAHPDEAPPPDEGEPRPVFDVGGTEEAIPDAAVSAPGGGAAADPAPSGRDRAGPPPPVDLADAKARRSGQAKRPPPWAAARRQRAAPAPAPPSLTRPQLADIEGKVTLLLSIPASFAAMIDPVCGAAAAENLDTIVRKAVPLIAQSPAALAWLAKDATVILWLDLCMALQPVGAAIWAHHFAGTVTVVDGRPVPSHRLPSGQVVPNEGAPPPAPEGPPLSAYTVPGHVPPVQRPA